MIFRIPWRRPWRPNYEFVIEIHTSATPSPSDQALALHTRFKMPRIALALLALVAGTTAFGVTTSEAAIARGHKATPGRRFNG